MPISIINRQNKLKIDLVKLRRSLKRLMKELCCADGEISLVLVDDAQIHEINKIYLKRDRPTNVISFAMTEGEFSDINPLLLGDIILSVETAYRDAATTQIDFMDEVEFLLIHGLLHLRGYDHEGTSTDMAQKMKDKERELFSLLRHYRID
jgi:probable rRNA maturation factor